jgi:hypothetical protein
MGRWQLSLGGMERTIEVIADGKSATLHFMLSPCSDLTSEFNNDFNNDFD